MAPASGGFALLATLRDKTIKFTNKKYDREDNFTAGAERQRHSDKFEPQMARFAKVKDMQYAPANLAVGHTLHPGSVHQCRNVGADNLHKREPGP